jgi:hypothetical protein
MKFILLPTLGRGGRGHRGHGGCGGPRHRLSEMCSPKATCTTGEARLIPQTNGACPTSPFCIAVSQKEGGHHKGPGICDTTVSHNSIYIIHEDLLGFAGRSHISWNSRKLSKKPVFSAENCDVRM